MQPSLNYSLIGDRYECPHQVIARARRTDKPSPVTQATTTRKYGESEDEFIKRLKRTMRDLISAYGYAHHITLFCRYVTCDDLFSNDEYQNISAELRDIVTNSTDHMERATAASQLADITISIIRGPL